MSIWEMSYRYRPIQISISVANQKGIKVIICSNGAKNNFINVPNYNSRAKKFSFKVIPKSQVLRYETITIPFLQNSCGKIRV